MRRLLCHNRFMIAPDGAVGKGFLSSKNAGSFQQVRHFGPLESRVR
jgi:hypothetical protein